MKGWEDVWLEEGVKVVPWKGGREGETEGNWRKPVKKRRKKKVKVASMILMVTVLIGGTNSMLLLEEEEEIRLYVCFRERK